MFRAAVFVIASN
jgi:hypothetical protein